MFFGVDKKARGKMRKRGAKGDTFYGKKYSPNSILMINGRKMVELRNYSTANVGQVSLSYTSNMVIQILFFYEFL